MTTTGLERQGGLGRAGLGLAGRSWNATARRGEVGSGGQDMDGQGEASQSTNY